MTKTLDLRGYTMGDATDATGDNVDVSIVYYDATNAAALDVANSVARDLGGLAVEVVPTPPPTAGACTSMATTEPLKWSAPWSRPGFVSPGSNRSCRRSKTCTSRYAPRKTSPTTAAVSSPQQVRNP